MKVRILTLLVVLAVLVSCVTACTPKDSYLIQVMKLAPESVGNINCIDIEAMAEDPDFKDWYDGMIIGLSDILSYEMVGLEASDISVFAGFEIDFEINWEPIDVLIGDFNLEDIRDTLEENYFVEGEYRGMEIWTDDFGDAVAFIDNMIVSGYADLVEACIRTHNDEEPSMYDNEDMKAVADKLPAGIWSTVFGSDYIYSGELLAGGMCLRNLTSGDEVCDINHWYKFDSESSAEAAMEDIENESGFLWDATINDASLSGQFIEITSEVEIPEDW